MLKGGMFQTPNGNYSIFEVEEKGYYRLDIVTENSAFNSSPDDVLYSVIRKKNVFEIGNRKLYDEYLKAVETCQSAKLTTETKSSWKDSMLSNYSI